MEKSEEPKKKRGRKPLKRDPMKAEKVRLLSKYFIPQKYIANDMGISVDSLVKYYSEDLDSGKSEGAVLAYKTLFKKAVIDGDRVLLMFFCKTQLGMKETSEIEISNPDGKMNPLDINVSFVADKEGKGNE